MKWYALASALLTWPLISFGALVRLHGAGLSCPDWPLCYGQLIPPPGFEIAMEVGHRFWATLLGLLIVMMTLLSFRVQAYRSFRRLTTACLILVILQGILGALTVTMVLWPPVVTFHLIGGNLLFAMLVYLSWISWNQDTIDSGQMERNVSLQIPPLSRKMVWMLAILFIIAASGGYNSSTYSGYACEAFPGCHEGAALSFGLSGMELGETRLPEAPAELQGRFLPIYANEWVHMLHRLISIGGGTALMFMAWAWLVRNPLPALKKSGWWIMILIPLEVLLGIANALLRIPIPLSSLHTALFATMVGILSYALVRAMHPMQAQVDQNRLIRLPQKAGKNESHLEKIPA